MIFLMFLGLEACSLKRMHCSMIWSFKFDEKSLNRGVTAVTEHLGERNTELETSYGHYVLVTAITEWLRVE